MTVAIRRNKGGLATSYPVAHIILFLPAGRLRHHADTKRQMINVAAFTSGKNDPASRFRIRQFTAPLAALGICVNEHYPLIHKSKLKRFPPLGVLMRLPELLASRSSDITWFGRELVGEHATLERFAPGKKLFDVDDAIWLQSANHFSEDIVSRCDGVIAGNGFLADYYRRHGAKQIWIVPTSVNTEHWFPPGKRTEQQRPWTVGWSGIWSNLKYLYAIEEPLAEFLTTHARTQLRVISDRKPAWKKIPDEVWHYTPWSRANEVGTLQELDVSLMPLEDTDWARGKCAFKMLLSLAVGCPVVVSPVGVNQEVLEKGRVGFAATSSADWYQALHRLYDDRGLATQMGREGRKVVEEYYSVSRSAGLLANIFRELADV